MTIISITAVKRSIAKSTPMLQSAALNPGEVVLGMRLFERIPRRKRQRQRLQNPQEDSSTEPTATALIDGLDRRRPSRPLTAETDKR